MSAQDDRKDELLKTPPLSEQGTTPLGSSDPHATVDLPKGMDFTEARLAPLTSRYDSLTEIAGGGMGMVYRARDRETNDLVALKVIKPEIAAQPGVIERFKSELLLARKITHKNVCRTYELLRFDNLFVITMEYVEGRSLRQVLQSPGGISLRRGLEWAQQICSALTEAHAQGVVHRDLKPENILIARDGAAKVMDFGIARSLESAQTQTGAAIGTPAYMSPEQAEGKPADERSDIYSVGLILYELFTGRPAFQADSAIALARMQVQDTPAAPVAVEPLLPPFLNAAIEKCLEKNPKRRFQKVSELAAALTEGRLPAEGIAADLAQPEELKRWLQRDWVLTVLGVCSLIYFLVSWGRVFPAGQRKLEIDAIGARRVAEETATRFGRPFSGQPSVELEYDPQLYRGLMEFRADPLGRSPFKGPAAALEATDFPFYWRVSFEEENAPGLLGHPTEDSVVVTRTGKVDSFLHRAGSTFLPSYQPPPAEKRREMAQRLMEQACGPPPPGSKLVETSGEEWGAAYSAQWISYFRGDRMPGPEISLWAEDVVSLNCRSFGVTPSRFAPMVPRGLEESIFRLGLAALVVAFLVWFGMGQGHRSPNLRKRLPWAVLLGVAGTWLFAHSLFGTSPSPAVFLISSLACSGLFLIALITVEQRFVRRSPGSVASCVALLEGRVLQPGVAMAVVRGTFAGFLLLALEVAAVQVPMWASGSGSRTIQEMGGMLSGFIDPGPVSAALTTFSAPLYVVASAVLHGFVLGFLIVGLPMGRAFRVQDRMRTGGRRARWKWWLVLAISIGFVVLIPTVALRMHLGYMVTLGFPYPLAPVLLGALLAVLIVKYDVLTAMVAVATAVLWSLNYPLLDILQEIGNGGQWAVFVVWAVVVLGAVVAASLPVLRKHGGELKEHFT